LTIVIISRPNELKILILTLVVIGMLYRISVNRKNGLGEFGDSENIVGTVKLVISSIPVVLTMKFLTLDQLLWLFAMSIALTFQ
jgi:hypothetical protein